MNLRQALVRLANEHPETRKDLLPLLRRAYSNPNMWVYRIQGDKVPRSVSRFEDLSWDEAMLLAQKYEAQGGWVDLEKSPDGNPPWMSVDSYDWQKGASTRKIAGEMSGVTKDDIKLKSGTIIPAGTRCKITLDPNAPGSAKVQADMLPEPVSLSMVNMWKHFAGFSKPPSIKTMERWTFDSYAKTPTGKNVEPDGFSSDGSASWLIILGFI